MKLNDLYFEYLIPLIFVFVAGCASSRVVKRVYDFEEGTMPDWTQVLPIASDTLEGPAHTFENGLLNMKTHAKHATLMVYNQQDIKDCAIEAKIMWRTFSTRYADVPKYSGVWVRLSEKGGYLFGIGKKSNIFAEGAVFGPYKVNLGKDEEFTKDSFMLKEFHVELNRWYHLKMAAKGSHF